MIKRVFVGFFRFWQLFISPIYPASCRFHPTCSQYAILAVEKHGVVKGVLKTMWRILRCNPFSKGGVDYP